MKLEDIGKLRRIVAEIRRITEWHAQREQILEGCDLIESAVWGTEPRGGAAPITSWQYDDLARRIVARITDVSGEDPVGLVRAILEDELAGR